MENLDKVLDKKSLADLVKNDPKDAEVSNEIEPTEDHIEQVLIALKNGMPPGKIRHTIRSEEGKSLTYGQIKKIIRERSRKIAELREVKEKVVEPKVIIK